MATPLWLTLANEGSGTTIADTSSGTPVNLAITAGGTGAWASQGSAGQGYGWTAATSTGRAAATASGTKIATALNGGKQVCIECAITLASGSITPGTAGICTFGPGLFIATDDMISLQWPSSGEADNSHLKVAAVLNGTDNNYSEFPTLSLGYQVIQLIVDTSQATAANRIQGYVNGFKAALTQNQAVPPQNSTFGSAATLETGTLSLFAQSITGYSYAFGALYSSASMLTGSDCLSHALRLFGTNDADPNAAGVALLAASTNGGTNDVSSSTADHSLSFTITIGSGANRKVGISVAYFGVTTGVTSITFNGSSTGVHLTAQQQATFTSLAGCDYYEILDANLPAAGTYTIAVTVDGALGVACGSPLYVEGVAQSYSTNTGLATGTGTSLTATLGSNAVAGSLLVGELLDVSFGDTPVSGSNQLRLVSQQTSSVIEQTVDGKYVPTAGANSMSWSGLTNTTGKIGIAVEVQLFPSNEALFFGSGTTS